MKDIRYKKYEPIWGSWYIDEELGSGSEGSMYRVRRRDPLGNEYYSAVKTISIPQNGDKDIEYMIACGMSRGEAEDFYKSIVEDAAREFDLMEKLKGNSHIASYEDHAIFRRDDCFGWDILIRIEELTPLVKYSLENPMTEEVVLKMGRDICRGLTLCKKYDIIHRDIKPENIFVAPSGDFKLGDFGIARIAEKTQMNMSRKGTYSFMAPEVYLGQSYDASIDVYSLGVVMYMYMNDGRVPFMPYYPEPVSAGDQEKAFISRVKDPNVPPPRNGSERIKKIILKACALSKDKRYKSAEEMLADIEDLRYEEKHNVHAAKKNKGSSRSKLIILAAVLLAVVGVAAYAMVPKEITGIKGIDKVVKIYIGEELSPKYEIQPDFFNDEKISFSSADERVFAVDKKGMITACSPGEAFLTMKVNDYKQESLVKVRPKVTEIKGIKSNIELTEGSSMKLKPRLLPSRFAHERITYNVKDRSVAIITSKGRLKALSSGTTKYTVTAGGFSKIYTVTVSEPVQVSEPAGSADEDGYDPAPSYSNDQGTGSNSGSSGSSRSSGSSGSSGSGSEKGSFDSSDDEFF